MVKNQTMGVNIVELGQDCALRSPKLADGQMRVVELKRGKLKFATVSVDL